MYCGGCWKRARRKSREADWRAAGEFDEVRPSFGRDGTMLAGEDTVFVLDLQ